jgi:hypothetical protein
VELQAQRGGSRRHLSPSGAAGHLIFFASEPLPPSPSLLRTCLTIPAKWVLCLCACTPSLP